MEQSPRPKGGPCVITMSYTTTQVISEHIKNNLAGKQGGRGSHRIERNLLPFVQDAGASSTLEGPTTLCTEECQERARLVCGKSDIVPCQRGHMHAGRVLCYGAPQCGVHGEPYILIPPCTCTISSCTYRHPERAAVHHAFPLTSSPSCAAHVGDRNGSRPSRNQRVVKRLVRASWFPAMTILVGWGAAAIQRLNDSTSHHHSCSTRHHHQTGL